MSSNTAPLVSIKCTVYNHEPYLRQCLDGFVMQKTNFPFEAIVHDDASTDGSAAIIREYAEKYPDIIKPIYETENQYSKKDDSLGRIMNAAIHPDAKYIAICEGDDYWIDPNKLQMQYDFMESHPECGLVCANYYENGVRARNSFSYPSDGKLFDVLMQNNIIGTLTIFFRKDIFDRFKEHLLGKIDRCIYLCFASCSRIYLIDKCVAVYRVLEESASHSKSPEKLMRSYDAFTWMILDTLVYLKTPADKIRKLFLIPRIKYLLLLASQAGNLQKVRKYSLFLMKNLSFSLRDMYNILFHFKK